MKLKRFLINSALLTAASVITQALCMIFRIYMSNTIGAEAIGLYQLIVTVYVFGKIVNIIVAFFSSSTVNLLFSSI